MKILKRITITLLFIIVVFNQNIFAQDPQFAQFYANPLYLNPALTGANVGPRVSLIARDQWPALGTQYNTYSASYDQQVAAIHGGIGFIVTHDVAGPASLTTNNYSAIYNYHIQVNEKFALKVAVQGIYFNKSIDWSKLTFGDMIDARSGFVYNTALTTPKLSNVQGWDFSTGVVGYTKYMYGGIAVSHINQPNEGLLTTSRLPMKITAHGGATIPIGDKDKDFSISPNILYQQQQNFSQFDFGLYVKKSFLVVGAWLRNKDAVSAVVGFQSRYFRAGLSYDVSTSYISNVKYGSYELTAALLFSGKDKVKKYTKVNCPFF